jgi:hypothetical protein
MAQKAAIWSLPPINGETISMISTTTKDTYTARSGEGGDVGREICGASARTINIIISKQQTINRDASLVFSHNNLLIPSSLWFLRGFIIRSCSLSWF